MNLLILLLTYTWKRGGKATLTNPLARPPPPYGNFLDTTVRRTEEIFESFLTEETLFSDIFGMFLLPTPTLF